MSRGLLSISSNTPSLRAQRQLGLSTNSLASSFEKLSSGLRINKASDDAAGLAVASSLKADTRIYSQGVRNLNDGISALNIADGAIANLSSIVTRIQELAEQAANGVVGSRQRKSLDAEAQALAKEYFRIAKTTDFNGLRLFDRSIQGLALQAGYGSGGSICSSLGGAMGTGTFGSSVSYQSEDGCSYDAALADLNGDGFLDLVTAGTNGPDGGVAIRLGNGDGSFQARLSYQTEMSSTYALSLADVNQDGVMDLLTAGSAETAEGRVAIRLGNGDGTFKSALSYQTDHGTSYAIAVSDVNGDGLMDMVTAGQTSAPPMFRKRSSTIRLGNGDGTFRASLSYDGESAAASHSTSVALSDLNRDGILDMITAGYGSVGGIAAIRLGNGDGTFRGSLSYGAESTITTSLATVDLNRDGLLDLITAGNAGTGYATVRLGNGDGTFQTSLSYQTAGVSCEALAVTDIDGDGIVDLITAGGTATEGCSSIRLGNGDGSFRASLSYRTESGFPSISKALAVADLNGDGVPDLMTAGLAPGGGYSTIRLANTEDGISPILPFSLATQADALQALPLLSGTLERLSKQRGQIGAFQSRLSSALSTLGSAILEYKGAQSRVEDVDVANETAGLVRHQILQQAASSVLAQANQAPSLALMLLRS